MSQDNTIPNIIHFIHIAGKRDFSFCNMLAILSAYHVQKPDSIFLYNNEEPKNNKYWDTAKKYVTLVKIDPPKEYRGIQLDYPQYQADVIRLQKLLEYGGIYLDTDILTIKSFDPLRGYDCVLGGEGYMNNVEGLYTTDLDKIGSISNAVIMAKPNNRFIKKWLDILPENFNHGVWAYHAVVLPKKMIDEDPTLFHVEPVESFIPFDFRNPYIFDDGWDGNDKELEGLYKRKLGKSYCFHLWETIWRDGYLNQINEDYVKNRKNLFTMLFKGYLDYLE